MIHVSLGGLDVSRIGLGSMSMSAYYDVGTGTEAESIRTIQHADLARLTGARTGL